MDLNVLSRSVIIHAGAFGRRVVGAEGERKNTPVVVVSVYVVCVGFGFCVVVFFGGGGGGGGCCVGGGGGLLMLFTLRVHVGRKKRSWNVLVSTFGFSSRPLELFNSAL